GINHVFVELKLPAAAQTGVAANPVWSGQNKVPGIKRVIAVASGKGGVGKSTASVNLSCALKRLGGQVGLLDCDSYRTRIPLMMGIKQRPSLDHSERIVPLTNHGVKLMSMG